MSPTLLYLAVFFFPCVHFRVLCAFCSRAGLEAILQTHLFAGYPRTLNALTALHDSGADLAQHAEESLAVPRAEWVARGEQVCGRVYGSAYGKLRQRLRRVQPDMDQCVCLLLRLFVCLFVCICSGWMLLLIPSPRFIIFDRFVVSSPVCKPPCRPVSLLPSVFSLSHCDPVLMVCCCGQMDGGDGLRTRDGSSRVRASNAGAVYCGGAGRNERPCTAHEVRVCSSSILRFSVALFIYRQFPVDLYACVFCLSVWCQPFARRVAVWGHSRRPPLCDPRDRYGLAGAGAAAGRGDLHTLYRITPERGTSER